MKGVHIVFTGRDLGERYFGRRLFDWPVLAWDRVRFIGDYVAAVAAESREIAEAAAAAIDVEYEELPAILDQDEASADGAPVLHPEPEKYAFMGPPKRAPLPHVNVQGYEAAGKGDIEAGFAQADRIIEATSRRLGCFRGTSSRARPWSGSTPRRSSTSSPRPSRPSCCAGSSRSHRACRSRRSSSKPAGSVAISAPRDTRSKSSTVII